MIQKNCLSWSVITNNYWFWVIFFIWMITISVFIINLRNKWNYQQLYISIYNLVFYICWLFEVFAAPTLTNVMSYFEVLAWYIEWVWLIFGSYFSVQKIWVSHFWAVNWIFEAYVGRYLYLFYCFSYRIKNCQLSCSKVEVWHVCTKIIKIHVCFIKKVVFRHNLGVRFVTRSK